MKAPKLEPTAWDPAPSTAGKTIPKRPTLDEMDLSLGKRTRLHRLLYVPGPGSRTVVANTTLEAPLHEPGVLPAWLAEKGANLVLARGMGGRAIQLFNDQGVEVIMGVAQLNPESLVGAYLAGEIGTGANACDH